MATAFEAGRKSDELRTRYLVTPLALGGAPRGQQEPRPAVAQQPKHRAQQQQKHPAKRPREEGNKARANKKQRISQAAVKHTGGPNSGNRYNRVKKNSPSQLHSSHNDKSICFAFQSPGGCKRGETCYHQHVCAHCFGPHSFENCPNFVESRAAYLKKRLSNIKLVQRSAKSGKGREGWPRQQFCHVPASATPPTLQFCHVLLLLSRCQNLRRRAVWAYPHCPQFCHVLSARVSEGGQCGLTHTARSFVTPVVVPESEKEGSVGLPTLPAVLSCVPPVSVSDPQKLQFSNSAKSHDSAAFSQVFARISSDSNPYELTVSELRTSGLTPQQKSTGFLARERAQVSAPSSDKNPSDSPAWKNRSLKVLSVFSGQELAPRVQEGAALISSAKTAQVKEVDISTWQLDKHRTWTTPAKELLHSVQQQSYDLVFVTLPTEGMSRALFANAQGPAPLRNKQYPYGFPWLSQHAKRGKRFSRG